jgi:Uma2 family endonuclease
MTFEEAARLDPDRMPGDLIEGRWVPDEDPGWWAGVIAGNVLAALGRYCRNNPGWSVAGGRPGVKLRHDPDTLRGPNVALIRACRIPKGTGVDGWLEGAPELAAEVVGRGQNATVLAKKAMEYIRAGSRMVWILDGEPKLLMLITADSQLRILGEDDVLEGGDVLPGFSCKVSEFFE